MESASVYNAEHPLEPVPLPSLLGNRRHEIVLAHVTGEGVLPAHVRLEREYREMLLKNSDLLDLANLPLEERGLAARRLELRRLYVPLRMQIDLAAERQEFGAAFERLEKRRFEQMRGISREERETREPIGVCLRRSRRLVVLGDPGAGKSTLLRWLTTAYLLRLAKSDDWRDLPDVQSLPDGEWLPILLRCRELPDHCLRGNLRDMLSHTLHLHQFGVQDVEKLLDGLEARLKAGTALLLIDGLDEISKVRERNAFCKQIERITSSYPDTAIVVTSRVVGYRELGIRIGHGFEHLTIADLSRQDKDDFARRWCSLTEPAERAEKAADELIRQIHGHDRIERLTVNPILLTTMALVKRKVGRLPQRRIELYSEAVKMLLNWRSDVDEPLDSHEAEPQLQYVAFVMASRGVQQLREDEILALLEQVRREYPNLYALSQHTPRDFLRLLESRTGLLFEAGTTKHKGKFVAVYEFRHLTFQEYMAGMALVYGRYPGFDPDQPLTLNVGALAGTIEKKAGASEAVVSEQWREALRLAVSAWPDNEIDDVLRAILTSPPEASPDERRARAVMACQCLADEPNASDAVVQDIVEHIAQAVDIREVDNDSILLESTTALRETRWYDLIRQILLNGYLIRANGYQGIVLGRLGALRDSDDLTHWLAERKVWLEANAGLRIQACFDLALSDELTSSHKDTFRTWIKQPSLLLSAFSLLDSPPPTAQASILYLFAALNVDESIPFNDEAIRLLCTHSLNLHAHETLAIFALMMLSVLKIQETSDSFIEALNDSRVNVRVVAASVLGDLKDPWAVDPLVVALGDTEVQVRENAVDSLRQLGDLRAVEPVITALADTEAKVRASAASALGQLNDSRAVEPLIAALNDPEPKVRASAASALGQLNDPQAVEPLITALTDGDSTVRSSAASALGQLNDPQAVEPLITALTDGDSTVRSSTARVLGQLNDSRAVEPLIAALSDTKSYVRGSAARALGQFKDPQAVEPLITMLSDGDANVRGSAVRALGHLKDPQAVEPLITMLSDGDANVRGSAADALGQFKDSRAVDPLIMMLSDGDMYLRASAASALGQLNDPQAVERLIVALSDTESYVRGIVARALGQFKDSGVVESLIGALSDTDANVRVSVASALGQFKDPGVVEPLVAALSDEDEDVRVSVASALVTLNDQRGFFLLATMLTDQKADVRRSALSGLAQRYEKLDQKLLSRDLDAVQPWLDPQEPITVAWMQKAARELELDEAEVRARYERLAQELGLKLEWLAAE